MCVEATLAALSAAPGISNTGFLSRMCLFTVVLCHLVALFFLTMCSCKTESYLPLKTIISPDKCQQRILPHMHRDLLFLAVSMLLAISYPLTVPRDFVRSPACEIIIDFVFLKANCFSGYLLSKVYGWLGCMFCKGFKHISKSLTLQISPFFELLNYFCLFSRSTTR